MNDEYIALQDAYDRTKIDIIILIIIIFFVIIFLIKHFSAASKSRYII